MSVCLSGGSVLEKWGERPQSSDGGADQACEWAGEQALNLRNVWKTRKLKSRSQEWNSGAKKDRERRVLISDCSQTKGEI